MPQIVEFKDSEIEFPDSMSADQIAAKMQELFPAPRQQKKQALLAEQAQEAKIGEVTQNRYDFLNALAPIVEPFTASGILNQPSRALGMADPFQPGVGVVTPEVAKQAAELSPAYQLLRLASPSKEGVAEGVKELTGRTLSGFTTPESIVTLPAAGGSGTGPALVRTAFAAEMARHLPEQVQHAAQVLQDPNATTAQKVVAVGEPAVAAGMIGTIAKHAYEGPPIRIPKQKAVPQRAPLPPEATPEEAALFAQEFRVPKEPVVSEQAPPPKEAPEAAGEVKMAAAEQPATAPQPSVIPEAIESQPLGIRPPGSAAVDKVIEYFRPPPDSPAPPIIPDVSTPLPDLQPKATANAVFSQPFAAEKIPVLGRLLGGKARIRDEQGQAVAAWFGERHGVGPAVASSVGEQIRGKVNSVFETDEAGNLNVIPRSGEQSLKISDVFEDLQRDPTSYDLTPEQRTVWNETITPILERHKELTDQYDLLDVVDEDGGFSAYFPRIVTERPPENVASLAGGRRVGAKQFFQKERAFKSEAEGWEKGYKYERDVEKRLVTGVERLYRAMADKRLAKDPVLGGMTLEQKLAELRTSYAPELASGEMTEANIQRIAKGLQRAGTVHQPGFYGQIFDAKTANMLNREFAREQSSVRRVIANANDFVKALNLGFDVGVGQIQLLPTLFRSPGVWAEAQARSIGAMFNPKVWSAYAEANQIPIRELAQFGSSVGRLPEMVSGLTGSTIQRIPFLRQAAKPFARQFQTALDVAKVELWKAWRSVTPPEEAIKVVQTLESTLNTARMESAMVSHGRSLMERVLLLAPSYYRGAINLVAAMGERGVSGKIARQTMGSFIAGSTALFTGIGLAVGMSMDEIKKRLNPMRPDFGMWQIELDGKKRNIGIGGIFRSFIRLAGNVAKTSMEEPENWKSLSPKKNPFTRWYRGHAGPVIGMTWDQFSGKDFLNREASLETASQKLGPLWLQNVIARQKGTPSKGVSEMAAEFAGLQTYPDPGPSGEVRRLARSWMAKSEDPKIKQAFERKQQEDFGLSDYAELYRALDEADQSGTITALQELRKSKKDSDILEALHTAKNRAFTGLDKAGERKFVQSLSAEEKELYKSADKQREDRYRAFLNVWRKRGPRPTP